MIKSKSLAFLFSFLQMAFAYAKCYFFKSFQKIFFVGLCVYIMYGEVSVHVCMHACIYGGQRAAAFIG